MKTKTSLSKNWGEVKTFFKNTFSKINVDKKHFTPVTKKIELPIINEKRREGWHSMNNRKGTPGRRIQRIDLGVNQIGNHLYKYIVHSY